VFYPVPNSVAMWPFPQSVPCRLTAVLSWLALCAASDESQVEAHAGVACSLGVCGTSEGLPSRHSRLSSALLQTQASRARSIAAGSMFDDGDEVVIDKVVLIVADGDDSCPLASILRRYCENHEKRCPISSMDTELVSTHADGTPAKGPQLNRRGDSDAEDSLPPVDVWPSVEFFEPARDEGRMQDAFKAAIFSAPLSRLSALHLKREPAEVEHILTSLRRNKSPQSCGSRLQLVDQVPLDAFGGLDYVLLDEELDRSLMMLRRKVGWSLLDMMYRRPPQVDETAREELPVLVDYLTEFLAQPAGELNNATAQFLETCAGGDESEVYRQANATFHNQWAEFSEAEQQDIEADMLALQAARFELGKCCSSNATDGYCSWLLENSTEWNARAQLEQVDGMLRRSLAVDSGCFAVVQNLLSE